MRVQICTGVHADSELACCAQVLAKCETRQALYNFRAITTAADGIVLSRGNLGLDLLPEKIALVQKAVCAACNVLGKPVLLTRVMDSTVLNPRPTRCVSAPRSACQGLCVPASRGQLVARHDV